MEIYSDGLGRVFEEQEIMELLPGVFIHRRQFMEFLQPYYVEKITIQNIKDGNLHRPTRKFL